MTMQSAQRCPGALHDARLLAAQTLPKPPVACQGWRLVSGLLCLGPPHPIQAAAPVYGVARAGDWVCLTQAAVTAWALVPSVVSPMQAPATQAAWQTLLAQLCAQQCRQAADLAAMRTGPAADRVRHLLLMLAADGEPLPALPSLRAMSQLVDAAPETVSRVVSALRQMQMLEGGRCGLHAPAVKTAPLAARALPKGLTCSEAAPRRARLQALQNAATSRQVANVLTPPRPAM